jgi:hypothetical protein
MQVDDLNTGIATFYDESSGLWEEMWGEWRSCISQADRLMSMTLARETSALLSAVRPSE